MQIYQKITKRTNISKYSYFTLNLSGIRGLVCHSKMLLFNNQQDKDNLCVTPEFFRLREKEDRVRFEALLKDKPHIKVYDQIESQLDDLVKSKHPKNKPEGARLVELRNEHLGNCSPEEYGVWVYYPWNERVVHLLDETEFIEMRTNRNIYKITREERDILSRQKIGVVGLSVGQSVSVTLAMERGFGEIRLADFDVLELTNLNRIRTGVHNLGIPKVVIVAREIKEIDPFLKVTLFDDGLTDENMDRFFTEGGKLDIVVDECDGLDMKILLRHKAKSLHIPVVMDASDRGTLDVERFDLEPDRPILHGFIDHLDHTRIRELKTNEEKIPYLIPMVGLTTMSDRLKASMVEVGQSITTWPQLASAVVLGGALGADVCRRIALDQYHESGRYFVDLEELVGDRKRPASEDYRVKAYDVAELTSAEMERIAGSYRMSGEYLSPDKNAVSAIVTAAGLAPSGGNSQPWKWLFYNDQLFLFHDRKQSVSWMDFNDTASYISFGTSIENLKIKAGELGLETSYELFPLADEKKLIGVFSFRKSIAAPYFGDLSTGLTLRLTNRKKGDMQPLERSVIQKISEHVSRGSEAELQVITDREQIERVAEIVSSVERLRFLFPQAHHELYTKEIVWPSESGEPIVEGIDVNTLELSESDKTGLIVASKPEVINLLNRWGGGTAFEKISKSAVASSSAIAMVTMPEYSDKNFIKGGEALQRAWITANLNGIAVQPISGMLFIFDRLNKTKGEDMPAKMVAELEELQKALYHIFDGIDERCPIFIFRLSNAGQASVRSLKKPLEEILKFSAQ